VPCRAGQTWVPSSQMSTLPRSASFAGNPQAPLRMTPHGMPNGLAHSLSADYCQGESLEVLLFTACWRHETKDSIRSTAVVTGITAITAMAVLKHPQVSASNGLCALRRSCCHSRFSMQKP